MCVCMCTDVIATASGSDNIMVPSFLCAAMVMCHVSWATAYSRRLFQESAMMRRAAADGKSHRDKRKTNSSDEDGGAVAYMPAYAIPDGSPVDPCVTCRPRKTTPSCRRNTGPSCSGPSTAEQESANNSTAATVTVTKQNCSTPEIDGGKPE